MSIKRNLPVGILLVAVFLLYTRPALSSPEKAIIRVDLDIGWKLDTLYIFKYAPLSFSGFLTEEIVHATPDEDGSYSFEIAAETEPNATYSVMRKVERDTTEASLTYFKGLSTEFFSLTAQFYLAAGDRINVEIERHNPNRPLTPLWYFAYRTTYSGKGSAKLAAKHKADSLLFTFGDHQAIFDEQLNYHHRQGRFRDLGLTYLEERKSAIPHSFYEVIKNDIIFFGAWYLFPALRKQYDSDFKETAPHVFKEAYSEALSAYFPDHGDKEQYRSERYIRFIFEKARFDAYLEDEENLVDASFQLLTSRYKGLARERALVMFFTRQTMEDPEKLYAQGLPFIQTKEAREVMQLVRVRSRGFKAYNFDLEDTHGNRRTLEEFKGKWVFIDFWFTGCGACVDFYQNALKGAEEHFKDDPRIAFITISSDRGKSVWKRSVDQGLYTSDKAINLYTNGEGWKHELIRYYSLQSFPSVILIDPDGKLFSFNSADLLVRDSSKLIQALRQHMERI